MTLGLICLRSQVSLGLKCLGIIRLRSQVSPGLKCLLVSNVSRSQVSRSHLSLVSSVSGSSVSGLKCLSVSSVSGSSVSGLKCLGIIRLRSQVSLGLKCLLIRYFIALTVTYKSWQLKCWHIAIREHNIISHTQGLPYIKMSGSDGVHESDQDVKNAKCSKGLLAEIVLPFLCAGLGESIISIFFSFSVISLMQQNYVTN